MVPKGATPEEGPMPIIKRRNKRVKVNLPVEIEIGDEYEEANLIEISLMGCSIKSGLDLHPSSTVVLQFHNRSKNGSGYKTFYPLKAKVIYRTRNTVRDQSKYGLEFIGEVGEEQGVEEIIRTS